MPFETKECLSKSMVSLEFFLVVLLGQAQENSTAEPIFSNTGLIFILPFSLKPQY